MFKQYLVALDTALTGNDQAKVEQFFSAPHNYFDVVDFVMQGEIHLSDGGYSRIVWSELHGNFFLTSNSRQAVKARWEAAVPEREAAEQYVRQVFNAIEPGSYPD